MGPEMIGLYVPVAGMAMIVALVIGRPAVKAWARKIENESKRPALPAEVATRLERMEQSIDAIAVEVERISEGQRFTTRLLADAQDTRALPASSPAKDSSA
jgi:hypothetical protein